jgi:hypothetical protein
MSVPPKNSFVPQAASRWRFKPQVLASLCALLALPLWGASPYRLLVIGDSISVGYTDNPTWSVPYQFGFRSGLYTRLTNSGMAVQFVGGGAGALGWEIWHPGQPAATGPLLDRPAQARIRDNVLKALPLILLWIWASATPASWTFGGEIIELTSPLVREVFQHDAQEQAAVRIAGRVPATTTQIEVRAELDPQATRGQVVEWTLVARDTQIAGGGF